MITYSPATDADLQGILDLQQRNLPRALHAHQRLGFTVLKTYQDPGIPDWAIVAWDWRAGRA